jgi:hypothetical protein
MLESPIHPLLLLIGLFVLWIVVARFVLPRFGVST